MIDIVVARGNAEALPHAAPEGRTRPLPDPIQDGPTDRLSDASSMDVDERSKT